MCTRRFFSLFLIYFWLQPHVGFRFFPRSHESATETLSSRRKSPSYILYVLILIERSGSSPEIAISLRRSHLQHGRHGGIRIPSAFINDFELSWYFFFSSFFFFSRISATRDKVMSAVKLTPCFWDSRSLLNWIEKNTIVVFLFIFFSLFYSIRFVIKKLWLFILFHAVLQVRNNIFLGRFFSTRLYPSFCTYKRA